MNALAYTFDSRKLFGSGFKHVENDIQCKMYRKIFRQLLIFYYNTTQTNPEN